MKFEPAQLQAKFKHAIDFGIEGSYNRRRAGDYAAAMQAHVASSSTRVVLGSFRGGQSVVLYVDPENLLVVMTDRDSVFISGWKLSDRQLTNVLERGSL